MINNTLGIADEYDLQYNLHNNIAYQNSIYFIYGKYYLNELKYINLNPNLCLIFPS